MGDGTGECLSSGKHNGWSSDCKEVLGVLGTCGSCSAMACTAVHQWGFGWKRRNGEVKLNEQHCRVDL